ncbi:MAG: Serine/threonine protein kinase [Symbiobacteriaceae bacterium]|jgi:serine/threonine-protein kinase|nr:Serine/threonine protein kinase [Symbiobacteriaceae bacterium]
MTGKEPFELLELLGTGGFAHTYRARVIDEDLLEDFGTDEVALKIPLNTKKERQLRHELELNASLYMRLKQMESPNIVRYMGFAVFRGQIVMAMEFAPSGTLRSLLGPHMRAKALPVPDAVQLAKGVVSGLAAIHSEHVVHRDIKPENILMNGQTPKIADLGIARMLANNELAATVTGTIYYMSPEVLCSAGASFPADIWSMGVMFYEMLTGKLPFGTLETPIGTMADLIRRGDYPPIPTLRPDVPRPLVEIVDRALSPDPARRFANGAEMHEALQRFQARAGNAWEEELAEIRRLIADRDEQKLARAERLLQDLTTRFPGVAAVYQQLGELHNLCQRYHEAIEAFRLGLGCDPESSLLHWDLALAYQNAGRRKDAVLHLERVLDSAPDASLRRHAATLLKVLRGPKP